MEIGSKGLQEANLTIPQSTSLLFEVVHTDDEGDAIDHSESTCFMAFQSKDKQRTIDLSECCTPSADKITVLIPSSVTAELDLGKMLWDLMVTMSDGETVRLLYGTVNVVDTYAMDVER